MDRASSHQAFTLRDLVCMIQDEAEDDREVVATLDDMLNHRTDVECQISPSV